MKREVFFGSIMVFFLLGTTAWGAEGIKIGFIDAQKVLDTSKEGAKVKISMEEYLSPRQKIINQFEVELKDLEEELSRQASVLSPEAKRMKEEDLRRKFAGYQRRSMELSKEIETKRDDTLKKFNQRLEEAVREIAEKEGYAFVFVFDKNGKAGALVYASETFDLTSRVIAHLDKNVKQ